MNLYHLVITYSVKAKLCPLSPEKEEEEEEVDPEE